MKKKKEGLMLGKMLQKIAQSIGAKVVLEPQWNIAGQITFKSGKKSYFRYNTLDINTVGSADISKDKDYANFFLDRLGFPIIPGSKTFFSDTWGKAIGVGKSRNIDSGYRYALKLGFPVIVKPNSGSQGMGVTLVGNKREFYRAMRTIFKGDRIALIQQKVQGKDYRIVVLDGRVISAYERIPLSVIGDGRLSILALLKLKQKQFVASSRDTIIKTDDPRITAKLARQKLTLRSILKKDEKLFLLDNANLSTGGDSVDITSEIHPEFRKIAIDITHGMGLRLCGVDLMINGDIRQKPTEYWVLETNAAPGLDHYVKIGRAQEKIVEDMYLQVLISMEKQIEEGLLFEEVFEERSKHILLKTD